MEEAMVSLHRISMYWGSPQRENKCLMHEENVPFSLVASLDVTENACGTNVTSGFLFMRRVWVLYMAQLSLFWSLYATELPNITLIKSLHISLRVLMRIAVCSSNYRGLEREL
jgi:hypothetical protein